MKLGFSWQIFEKKSQILSSITIRPFVAEMFHADGRTDMTLIVYFRNFVNAPTKTKPMVDVNEHIKKISIIRH
jgi:hypothetical protein